MLTCHTPAWWSPSNLVPNVSHLEDLYRLLYSGYVHTKPDNIFYPERPSVHTKTAFSVSENGTFWKRSPKWINLKALAKCVNIVWTAKTEFFEKTDVTTAMWLCRSPFSTTELLIMDSETVWKRLMWMENILSVFAAKVAFSNLSGLVWT